jgi:mannan endo-1,6-alpha-mannosidase
MLDYQHYTGDTTYNDVITEAILSQVGPNYDLMVPRHEGDEGNDDQAFWAFTILEAAERNFPQPNDTIPAWLDIAANAWNTMAARWDTEKCGGGLYWQIFESNSNGMHYKNSVSNGGFFQMSARLARATGNNTYVEWAQKVWDWSVSIGFVNDTTGNGGLDVLDGADISDDCQAVNQVSFSYSQAIYLYGAAVLYNYTDGNQTWGDRVTQLLTGTDSYFSPYDNATDVMYEHACEQQGVCKTDMFSFKAYMSRFLWATTQMVPSTFAAIQARLTVSAAAAAAACTGGDDGVTCGHKWYVGGWDGSSGLGQQLCAQEIIQGLLITEAAPPFKAGEIQHVTTASGSANTTNSNTDTSSTSPTPTKRSNGSGHLAVPLLSAALAVAAFVL